MAIWRVSITVLDEDENEIEDKVILALQEAGLEIFPESVWAERLED